MEQQQQQPHISLISWIELLVGCRDGETSRVHAWLESFPRVPLDEAIATEKISPWHWGGWIPTGSKPPPPQPPSVTREALEAFSPPGPAADRADAG